jgi:acetyltransferase
MRFFSMVKTLSRDSLIRLCHLDYNREMALAAVLHDDGGPRLLGVSRYYLNPETGDAEFALVVSDAYQRQGLGRHLMQRLIAVARERGVQRLIGEVLAENAPMLRLMRSLGFSPPVWVEDQVVRVEMDLTTAAPH